MVVSSVVAGFALAVVVAWLVLFPGARASVGERLAVVRRRGAGVTHGMLRGGRSMRSSMATTGGSLASGAGMGVVRHRYLVAVATLILCLPPVIAFLVGGTVFHGFDLGPRAINDKVADLLDGEHLVPPPPLPPAVFAQKELAVERPMLVSANRNWQLLDADFASRLLVVFKIMKEQHGYDMVIIEGYRTPQRQVMLASLGAHVTNASAFQSYHQFGLAADSAFMRDGRLVITERDPWAMRGYQLFGEVAESVGLHWGGRWRMRDFGHVELRRAR